MERTTLRRKCDLPSQINIVLQKPNEGIAPAPRYLLLNNLAVYAL